MTESELAEKRLDFEARVTAMQRDLSGKSSHLRRLFTGTVSQSVLFLLMYGFGTDPTTAARVAVGTWCLLAVTWAALLVVVWVSGAVSLAILKGTQP